MHHARNHSQRSWRGPVGALAALVCAASVTGKVAPVATPSLDSLSRCIRFITPTPGSMIVDPVCTVMVETRCEVGPIEFQVAFLSPDRKTIEVVDIGRAVRPPYSIPWTTTSIPNQLYDGAELQARCTGTDSTVLNASVKGISVFHGILTTPRFLVPYKGCSFLPRTEPSIYLLSPDSSVTAKASVAWSSDSLLFAVDVTDPHLNPTAPPEVLSRVGVEFLLDPYFSRGAYPTQREFVAAVPMYGNPFRTVYSAQAGAGGSFELTKTTQSLQPGFWRVPREGGYTVRARIPMNQLREVRPDSLGFNLIIKYLDGPTSIGEISWVPVRGNDVYSPCIWGKLVLGPRVRFAETAVLFGLAFVVGCGIAILIGLPFLKPAVRVQRSLRPGRYSPSERTVATNIMADIEAHVTERGLTLAAISRRLSIAPGYAAKALRKFTGRPFAGNLLATRLELAKERLRSSRTSEAFIAESCGFADAKEMHKAFRKFSRTTPDQFRREFHVA